MKEGGERKMTSGSKNRKRHDLIEMHPLRLESPETKVRERKSKKNKRGGGGGHYQEDREQEEQEEQEQDKKQAQD